MGPVRIAFAVVLFLLAAGLFFLLSSGSPDNGGGGYRSSSPATFVGGATCATCHEAESKAWSGSHHDHAMQEATEATVLGDFNDARFEDAATGVKARFHRDGEKFLVTTAGSDGADATFEVKYTFGVHPLQQYLIPMPGGRYQALTIAWDVDNRRWYTLYPDRPVAPDDWLHWTQRGQNWNANCADCHSTNLVKGYDPASDSYETTWSEINVSCEACHGPGSNHVDWAKAGSLGRWAAGDDNGLVTKLKDPHRAWGFDERGQPTLLPGSDRNPDRQIDACARCHSRRGPISEQWVHGERFLDHFAPQLLQQNVYHPDGQILDEVYVWGSFTQSRMYHSGVRCSDCHEPHGLTLHAPGNSLCVRCHTPQKYDSPAHHHHTPGTSGASCVECHMPSTNYMVIDPRRDHSLRIPRPDLSAAIGTPNACNGCHADRDAAWASDNLAAWFPRETTEPEDAQAAPARDPAELFAAAWAGNRTAGRGLRELLGNQTTSPFIRASAAATLGGYLSQATVSAAVAGLSDTNALVRGRSAALLGALPIEQRAEPIAPLLGDPVQGVRFTAARLLATVPRNRLSAEDADRLKTLLEKQHAALLAHADNRGGRLALGGFYEDLGRSEQAIAAYEAAVAMDRRDIDAGMALAEAHIRAGNDAAAEPVLRRLLALPKPPEVDNETWQRAGGSVRYQLGLLLAANGERVDEGIELLRQAAGQLPDAARVRYNLALALNGRGLREQAEMRMRQAVDLAPTDPDMLYGLATLLIEHGKPADAAIVARRLKAVAPQHPAADALLQRLNRPQGPQGGFPGLPR